MSKSFAELKQEVYAEMRKTLVNVKQGRSFLIETNYALANETEKAYMREFMPEIEEAFTRAVEEQKKIDEEVKVLEGLIHTKRMEAWHASDAVNKARFNKMRTEVTAPWIGFFDDLEKEDGTVDDKKQ